MFKRFYVAIAPTVLLLAFWMPGSVMQDSGRTQSAGYQYSVPTLLTKGPEFASDPEAVWNQIETPQSKVQAAPGDGTSPISTAANAGMIIFREGLEAIIILASLMGSLKGDKEHEYRKPMWLGAAAAIVATGLTWLLAGSILQSLASYGPKLLAVVSLIAVAVLLLITNWFFHKFYWTGWLAGFHARKRRLLSGEAGLWLGLVALGFTSIYREGFETVLFLQALILESGTTVVLIGLGIGLVAVALVGVVTFWLQVSLPYKKMLVMTGILVGAVLLQMVGMTVHAWQRVGWLPVSFVQGLTLPRWLGIWLGIYPVWEGLLAQLAAGAFVIGTYYLAEAQQKRERDQRVQQSQHGHEDIKPII